MARAPYPARIAAGLIVTAIEETRKLPTLIVTLPMTAVSQTLQMGMRAQQNIAELAIKGDFVLESLFDKPSEQPEWAHFDNDPLDNDPVLDSGEPEVDRTAPLATPPSPQPPSTKPAAPTAEPTTSAAPTEPSEKRAPAKKGAAKKTAPKKSAARKTAAKKAVRAEPVDTPDSDTTGESAPASDAGRFALYSSTPDDLPGASAAKKPPTDQEKRAHSGVKAPEVAVYIDYDALTLAQLRAKLRSVTAEELADLVAYEKATRDRVHFISMLDNRIVAQQKRQSST